MQSRFISLIWFFTSHAILIMFHICTFSAIVTEKKSYHMHFKKFKYNLDML